MTEKERTKVIANTIDEINRVFYPEQRRYKKHYSSREYKSDLNKVITKICNKNKVNKQSIITIGNYLI